MSNPIKSIEIGENLKSAIETVAYAIAPALILLFWNKKS